MFLYSNLKIWKLGCTNLHLNPHRSSHQLRSPIPSFLFFYLSLPLSVFMLLLEIQFLSDLLKWVTQESGLNRSSISNQPNSARTKSVLISLPRKENDFQPFSASVFWTLFSFFHHHVLQEKIGEKGKKKWKLWRSSSEGGFGPPSTTKGMKQLHQLAAASEASDSSFVVDEAFAAAMAAVVRAPPKNFKLIRQEWAAIRIQSAFRGLLVKTNCHLLYLSRNEQNADFSYLMSINKITSTCYFVRACYTVWATFDHFCLDLFYLRHLKFSKIGVFNF